MSQENQTPDYMSRLSKAHYAVWKKVKQFHPDAVVIFQEGQYCFCFMQDALTLHCFTQLPLKKNEHVLFACGFTTERLEWAIEEIGKTGFGVVMAFQAHLDM